MGILQAWILECVAMPSSRGAPWRRDWTQISPTAAWFFTVWATRKTQNYLVLHFVCWEFITTNSISLLVIAVFKFSVCSWFCLNSLHVFKNLSIFSRLSNLFMYCCSLSSVIILCISMVSILMFPLLFLILFIWVVPLFFFFLGESKRLPTLLIIKKNTGLIQYFLLSYWPLSLFFLLFVISFLLILNFGFYSFSNSLRCQVRFFVWDLSYFLM